MNPELTRQFGNRPIPLDRRQRHLGLVRPVVLLACPLHVLLPRHRRFLGAGLHLSQLSHFRGPAHYFSRDYEASLAVAERVIRSYPDYPLIYRWHAAALSQLGRTAEAKEALKKALAIAPAAFDLYVRQCAP